jgi:hypothetical protein
MPKEKLVKLTAGQSIISVIYGILMFSLFAIFASPTYAILGLAMVVLIFGVIAYLHLHVRKKGILPKGAYDRYYTFGMLLATLLVLTLTCVSYIAESTDNLVYLNPAIQYLDASLIVFSSIAFLIFTDFDKKDLAVFGSQGGDPARTQYFMFAGIVSAFISLIFTGLGTVALVVSILMADFSILLNFSSFSNLIFLYKLKQTQIVIKLNINKPKQHKRRRRR